MKDGEGYVAVAAPLGAKVQSVPSDAEKIVVNGVTTYFYGGAYYEKVADGYKVVPATAGAVVSNLPDGGEEVKIGDQTYVQFGETYYQPIQKDGNYMYEVVQVKDAG